MFEHWASLKPAVVDQGRRPLDLAEGIVMTLRRTDPATAFAEMVKVAADHSVTVLALAEALIDLVACQVSSSADTRARDAAVERWGSALR
jgi:hypothetical protein